MAEARKIKAAGDTWRVQLGEREEREGFRTLLFFCVTTNQRPYRVVEVPVHRVAGQTDLDRLDDASLRELFAASRSMGYPPGYD